MSDLFLEPPSRPRSGCLFTSLAILLIAGALVWFFFFRDKPAAGGTSPAPAPAAPASPGGTRPPPAAPGTGASVSPDPPAPPSGPPSGPFNPATDRGAALMIEAGQFRSQDKLLEARGKAAEVLKVSRNPDALRSAEALLGELNIQIFFNPIPSPDKMEYIVKSGDVLSRIAQKNGSTVDLIARSNRITGTTIRPRQRLLLPNGKFRIQVSKSRNDLLVLFNDTFFKRYRVGTGEYNKTPVGVFKVTDKISEPIWWRPDGRAIPYGDPENLLGTRWLSLDIRSYGIHGTWQPETIGKQASAGCIRMLNADVEELYVYITVGTQVEIKD